VRWETLLTGDMAILVLAVSVRLSIAGKDWNSNHRFISTMYAVWLDQAQLLKVARNLLYSLIFIVEQGIKVPKIVHILRIHVLLVRERRQGSGNRRLGSGAVQRSIGDCGTIGRIAANVSGFSRGSTRRALCPRPPHLKDLLVTSSN